MSIIIAQPVMFYSCFSGVGENRTQDLTHMTLVLGIELTCTDEVRQWYQPPVHTTPTAALGPRSASVLSGVLPGAHRAL